MASIDERVLAIFAKLTKPAIWLTLVLSALHAAPEPDPNTKPPELARDMAQFHATWLSPPWWLVIAPAAIVLLGPWIWMIARIAWISWRRSRELT